MGIRVLTVCVWFNNGQRYFNSFGYWCCCCCCCFLNVSNDIGMRWKRKRFKWMRRCKHKLNIKYEWKREYMRPTDRHLKLPINSNGWTYVPTCIMYNYIKYSYTKSETAPTIRLHVGSLRVLCSCKITSIWINRTLALRRSFSQPSDHHKANHIRNRCRWLVRHDLRSCWLRSRKLKLTFFVRTEVVLVQTRPPAKDIYVNCLWFGKQIYFGTKKPNLTKLNPIFQ